jgi:predicted small integral membrane protein
MARHPAPSISAAATLACLLLPGCVIVPTTIDTYDTECQTVSHHLVLQSVQIAEINHCRNQECTMMAVAGAATVAVSAIVSGSIVIVGNAAYWIERRATCQGPVVVTPQGQPVIAPGTPPAPIVVPD